MTISYPRRADARRSVSDVGIAIADFVGWEVARHRGLTNVNFVTHGGLTPAALVECKFAAQSRPCRMEGDCHAFVLVCVSADREPSALRSSLRTSCKTARGPSFTITGGQPITIIPRYVAPPLSPLIVCHNQRASDRRCGQGRISREHSASCQAHLQTGWRQIPRAARLVTTQDHGSADFTVVRRQCGLAGR
jgi:hypothetical protein